MGECNMPAVVLVFSGKRKVGKDFVTDILLERLGSELCVILRLSGPLKQQFAKENDLDYAKLLDATSYKEDYRAKMIHWGEEQRRRDPSYFCRLAIKAAVSPEHQVWIVSDARRQSDIAFFRDNYPQQTVTVRVTADMAVRSSRGFVYTAGIDDAESECGLDDRVTWDFVIANNGDEHLLQSQLTDIMQLIQERLSLKTK